MSLEQYARARPDQRELSNQACELAGPLDLADLAGILGIDPSEKASWGSRGGAEITRVCIDSRAAGAATVFVALKGERVDGHGYVADVARAGCVAALVSAEWARSHGGVIRDLGTETGLVCLVVPDPLRALQDWASAWLGTHTGMLRVGITGSNGKTTTKELLASVLSGHKRLFASPGNLNSVIGLPLAALAVPAGTEIGLFEMAMSEKDEMARLARLVFPDLAIITNIGTAHIGNIGSQQGIALEKKQIFSHFAGQGVALVPGDDDFAHLLASGVKGTVIRFGEHDTVGYEGWEACESGQSILWRGTSIHLHAPGRHVRSDALAVISLADHLGLEPAAIKQGIEAWRPAFGRNELLEGRMQVIQDCYNANPDSMKAALEAFAEIKSGTGGRCMVLGDMRELGDYSAEAHAEIGRRLADIDLDVLFLYGPEMAQAWTAWQAQGGQARRAAGHYGTYADLEAQARANLLPGDLVLLKASRGMELERLTPILLGSASDRGKD